MKTCFVYLKRYVAGIFALCLSGTAYSAEPARDEYTDRKPPKIHLNKNDQKPIEFGIALLDTIVAEVSPLQRYMERREIIRSENLLERPDTTRYCPGIPSMPLPLRRIPTIERNAMKLGAAGLDKGVQYILRKTNVNTEKFNARVMPTAGGAYMSFRLSF